MTLYRRHYQAREVPPSERPQEGTAPAEGATYDDTTEGLTAQQVSHDGATTLAGRDAERDGGAGDETADQVSEDEHSADELRDMARELGLPTSGTKVELAERINAKLAE